MVVLLIFVVSLVFVIGLAILERRRLGRYWLRSCTGAEWRRCFPDASKEEIRSFLQAFIDAFGFRSKNRLAFSPEDKVLDVYRTVYPGWAVADAMELETFAEMLERNYGIDHVALENAEVTLGELFDMTRNANR